MTSETPLQEPVQEPPSFAFCDKCEKAREITDLQSEECEGGRTLSGKCGECAEAIGTAVCTREVFCLSCRVRRPVLLGTLEEFESVGKNGRRKMFRGTCSACKRKVTVFKKKQS